MKDLYFCGDDLMRRGRYAQTLKKIINNCDNYPRNNDNISYVIGIDAPWGTGKTTFINMLVNYLKGYWMKPNLTEDQIKTATYNTGANIPTTSEQMAVVYYDAWKNDFWDNAFEPLFDCLIQAMPIAIQQQKEDIVKMFKSSGKIISLVLKGFINKQIDNHFDKDVLDNISAEFKEIINNGFKSDYQTYELFPEYCVFRDALKNLEKCLNEILKKQKRLIVFIDELDRCKPTFAVQTLEIVKHLFNIKGLVFVFSLDIKQLSHCIKTVYGSDFDSIGYLERFFNYLTLLPHNNMLFAIDGFIKEFNLISIKQSIKDKIVLIAEEYKLSLRELRTILCTYFVLHNSVFKNYESTPNAEILLFYFLIVKYKNPVIFYNATFLSEFAQLKELLINKPIPFVDITEDAYGAFIKDITSANSIKNTDFSIVSNDEAIYKANRCVEICYNNKISFSNGETTPINNDMSLSLILYSADFKEYDSIKACTPLEHIYRRLEIADFIQ